ncbi:27 kDa hemolymph protein precursor, putative [Pediculus humanus corporis]|uniref:27 kDa hemolymph protein, putative n=1 Tax=Pediculus humanus subsp. corporis TaxID=121224 RepID=E0VKF6_PEDHC|nr:27 kDa hemolymph protein precursor, putative [Pediculus humanus corporis]EEB13872.1 27 kDa hemolymph protein precursor, putative [Pediculus humanus corporis]
MEKAKPTGDLDSIFKKYCKKSPDFKNCVSNFTEAFQPCLEKDEKSSVATIMNVTEQLAEFICYKEGDRIALFIAEGGPECLESSKESIGECVQTVYKKKLPKTENVSLSDLTSDIPLLLFQTEQCESFHKFQKCVVGKLESCKEPTPANIIDSLFTFIKRATPCASYKFVEEPTELSSPSGSSISYNFTSSAFFILACLSALKIFF